MLSSQQIISTQQEPMLEDDPMRFVLFPIPNHRIPIWNAYKKQMACFWTAEEIDFAADKSDWESLDGEEKAFIDYMFGYDSVEVFGHNKSSFSVILNNLKNTNNFYNN